MFIKKLLKAPLKVIKAPFKGAKAVAKATEKGVDKVSSQVIFGIVRHILTTAGGALVANGMLTGDQLSDGVGAIITVAGLVWSILHKKQNA